MAIFFFLLSSAQQSSCALFIVIGQWYIQMLYLWYLFISHATAVLHCSRKRRPTGDKMSRHRKMFNKCSVHLLLTLACKNGSKLVTVWTYCIVNRNLDFFFRVKFCIFFLNLSCIHNNSIGLAIMAFLMTHSFFSSIYRHACVCMSCLHVNRTY